MCENYRPIPFYFINTCDEKELSYECAYASLTEVKDAGYGGVIFFNKPPIGFSEEEYLSSKWFQVTENFILAAQKLELDFWINDGFDYPPGDAAGRIKKVAPNLKQQRIFLADNQIKIEELDWGFPDFEIEESSTLFIKFVYEEFKKYLGKYFGNGIKGFFSDADNRRYNHFTRKFLQGGRYYPWCDNFAEKFLDKFGYNCMTNLKEIFNDKPSQIKYDYWLLCGELYQNWFKNNYSWCKENGLLYSFHTSDTGPFDYELCDRSSLFTEGLPLEIFKYSDMPGTDHEISALDGGTHYDKRLQTFIASIGSYSEPLDNNIFSATKYDLRAKYTASAAYLNDKKRVLCEAFAANNWNADFKQLRRIATWQIMQGINFFVPHAVHYRFREETTFFAPPEFLHSTLKNSLREFNDFLAKYSQILAESRYDVSVGVVDVSPEILRGEKQRGIFDCCDKLNRLPVGYVICSKEQANKFDKVIDSSNYNNFDYNHLDISFSGGEIAWMPRIMEDGTKFILCANVWSDKTLQGTLKYYGREIDIELMSGEISIINGPFEDFRTPDIEQYQELELSELPILEKAQNIIPITTNTTWENRTNLKFIKLIAPKRFQDNLLLNQQLLPQGKECKYFDNQYLEWILPNEIGKYELTSLIDFKQTSMPFIIGDFSVEVKVSNPYNKLFANYYQLEIYLPQEISFVLDEEKTAITLGDWCKQGYPFYSGSMTFDLGVINASKIKFEIAGVSCELFANQKSLGKKIFPPYEFSLEKEDRTEKLSLKVTNTMSNQFDAVLNQSGVSKVTFID